MVVYCDAATSPEGKSVATSIFMRSRIYEGMYVGRYSVSTSAEGELLGILQSLEWIDCNFPEETHIVIRTDHEHNALFLNNLVAQKATKIPKYKPYREIWERILPYLKKYSVEAKHIQSHTNGKSFCNVCDQLSRKILKQGWY